MRQKLSSLFKRSTGIPSCCRIYVVLEKLLLLPSQAIVMVFGAGHLHKVAD